MPEPKFKEGEQQTPVRELARQLENQYRMLYSVAPEHFEKSKSKP